MKMTLNKKVMKSRNRSRHILTLGMLIFLVVAVMVGCGKKLIPHSLVTEYENRKIRSIAVLPAQDKAANAEVNTLLRQRVVDGLYYKGYPKVSLKDIDEKLATFFKGVKTPDVNALPPRDVGDILGVDAVLYTTLQDCSTSFFLLYASSSVKVHFALYHAKTGELLWQTDYRVGERNFDVTPGRLKMESCKVYEPALFEIINKAMETLPDGPDV